ncbi:hypothetical protein [Jejuia spongiicola]|uniref:Uncharacterized protein n=1 Tax=Jejuia spongiicola TaxID=2942207 RepID=A0ABT0QGY6_9FLAO|nr:hypothetical protein [Jejuia spongiicola]MCL6296256.1 hypothetical protein [Jejuia spongiicola]
MKKIKVLSILISIVIILIAFYMFRVYKTESSEINIYGIEAPFKEEVINNTSLIEQSLNKIEKLSSVGSGESSEIERSRQLDEMKHEITTLSSILAERIKLEDALKEKKVKPKESGYDYKLIFSAIFLIAALFVILSKKYDEDTRKWAFSVLTLIAGVWIGTI